MKFIRPTTYHRESGLSLSRLLTSFHSMNHNKVNPQAQLYISFSFETFFWPMPAPEGQSCNMKFSLRLFLLALPMAMLLYAASLYKGLLSRRGSDPDFAATTDLLPIGSRFVDYTCHLSLLLILIQLLVISSMC